MAIPDQSTWIDEQLSVLGLKDTKKNRDMLAKRYNNRYNMGTPGNWYSYFQKQFPQFASMFDGADGEAKAIEVFGQDVINLFKDVANNPADYDLSSNEGLAAFDSKLLATKYYQDTTSKQRAYDTMPITDRKASIDLTKKSIADRYGELGFSDADVEAISEYAVRNALSELALQHYVYSYADINKGKSITQTVDAGKLRAVARAYGYNPGNLDDYIESILTGEKVGITGEVYTEDSLRQKAKDYAKILYPHLNQQLDNNYSLEDIFEPYKEVASRILDISPNAIDFADNKWKKALSQTAQGTQMNLSEWESEIKSNPEYEYQYTKQAIKDSQDMAFFIARAFGKVR
jgi:hypothetical protein